MQTSFTPAQLRDPALAAANQELRRCVHCGLCTATCPTFVLLGDELDGPRGRIYLIKDMLESGRPATEEVARHLDRCLSCLSCTTTCPSGVQYARLIDQARVHVEATYRRPLPDRLLRAALAAVLPHPARLRAALRAARAARPFGHLLGRALPQGRLAARLAAMLALAPGRPLPRPTRGRGVHRPEGPRRGRVALLEGCAQSVLAPSIQEATIRLLTRLGIEVVVADAGCCGALTHHMGRPAPAHRAARRAIAAWRREIEGEGLDAIIVTTSGCGTVMKEYGAMFRGDPVGEAPAREVAERVLDITEYLGRIGYAATRPPSGLNIAYHAACSLQHGQRVTEPPKALLRQAGFAVREPAEAHLCCGSAGTYNLLQPEIAGRLRARKLANLAATNPDAIAAGNIGCLVQLGGAGVPVLHTVELLDWMAGGPRPAALG